MNVGFLGFDQYHGKSNIGSSRIRIDWLLKYWNSIGPDIGSAERYVYGGKYDVVVLQKAYWVDFVKEYGGIKILDLCDADWLSWQYKIVETIQHIDAITCSTEAIARFVVQLTDKPVWVIPDRVDFEEMKKDGKRRFKEHEGDLKKAVWFGYADNFPTLDAAVRALVKRNIELLVVSDKTYVPQASVRNVELTNYPWGAKTWLDDLLRADVVINPKFEIGRFKYKSDNKTTQAWALGLPVAHIDKDLDRFKTAEARIEEANKRYDYALAERNVHKSVFEMKELIQELNDKRVS